MSKVTIYLSNNEFCLDQQLTCFLNNEHRFSVFISPLASKIESQYIKSKNGFFINFNNSSLEYLDFLLGKVTEITKVTQVAEVEIHFPIEISNLTYLAHGLIRNLHVDHAVFLHLYDGSIFDVLNRMNFIRLEQETKIEKTFSRLTDELSVYLQNNKIIFSPRVDSLYLPYCWHSLFPTCYHLVCYNLIKENISCLQNIIPHIDQVKIDYMLPLNNDKFIAWLRIKKINISTEQMQNYYNKKILFISLPFPLSMEAERKYLHESYMHVRNQEIENVLNDILQNDMLTSFDTVIIRPNHSGDTKYINQFVAGLLKKGINAEVNNDLSVHLLNRLSGNVFFAGGYNLSSSLIEDKILFILLNESREYASTKAMVNLIQKLGVSDAIPMLYLDETRQLPLISHFGTDDEITISMTSSLGDCMFAIACMQQVKEKYNKKITFVTHRAYMSIAKCSPWIDNVHAIEDQGDINLYLYRQEELGRKVVLCDTLDIVSPFHQIDACIRKMDMLPEPQKLNMMLDLSGHDFSSVDAFLSENIGPDRHVVLLHANIGDPNRTWSGENWNDLANRFIKDGWQVIAIGSSNNKYKETQSHSFANDKVIDAVDKFSILETIYLMRKCQLLVATDSGPVALAGATDIAIVAIYTIVPGTKRIAYRHGSLGWNSLCINLKCQYGHCMALSIDDDFCKNKLNSNIQMGRLNTWCPYGDISGNEYRYNCIEKYISNNLYIDIKKFIRSKQFYLQN